VIQRGVRKIREPVALHGLILSHFLYERRLEMKWETPKATDLRFGMEITMYVANR
jgi:coenzyme PQQ precursor peptide PqqA